MFHLASFVIVRISRTLEAKRESCNDVVLICLSDFILLRPKLSRLRVWVALNCKVNRLWMGNPDEPRFRPKSDGANRRSSRWNVSYLQDSIGNPKYRNSIGSGTESLIWQPYNHPFASAILELCWRAFCRTFRIIWQRPDGSKLRIRLLVIRT